MKATSTFFKCRSLFIRAFLWIVFLVLHTTGFSQSYFTDVGSLSGVVHHNVSPDYMGGGVAFFDFDNDGFEDIYLTGGTRRDKLFKNNGNGTFTDVSEISGINNVIPAKTTGVVTGDINNNGFRDIFVTVQGNKPNYLFLNNGDGTFSEISQSAGITGQSWSMGAAFGDFNLDGYLDLYIINYIKNNSLIYNEQNGVVGFSHECYPNKLYLNNGDNTFTDVSVISGTNDNGCALAVTFTDFDQDDVPDIYVANDFGEWVQPNIAFRNTSTPQFADLSSSTGMDVAIYGMGIAVGDFNHDGFFDYYITNLGKNVLLKNNGDGTFSDIAEQANVENEKIGNLLVTGWGTAFMDFDLDGWEDLVVSNGYVPAAKFIETIKLDPNKLYKNNGDGSFQDVSEFSGIADEKIGRGLAVADFDNDGDPDLLINNINIVSATEINVSFYRNDLDNSNNWIKVKLQGTTNNRDAFGAKVIAFAGNDQWLREIDGGSSHGSQSSSIALIGLGAHNTVDSIIVRWPGGATQKFEDINAKQTILIVEGSGIYEKLGCMDTEAINFDPSATISHGCRYDEILGVDYFSKNLISLFPNPVGSTLHFEIPDHLKRKELFLLITDFSGRSIREMDISKTPKILDRSGISPGIYIYHILDGNQVIQNGKLIFK